MDWYEKTQSHTVNTPNGQTTGLAFTGQTTGFLLVHGLGPWTGGKTVRGPVKDGPWTGFCGTRWNEDEQRLD